MGKPPEDPRVTDLRRYRMAREEAARKPPPKQKRRAESFLGSNPKAGLYLAIVLVVLAAIYAGPMLLQLLSRLRA